MPIVYSPAPHFFLGIGPRTSYLWTHGQGQGSSSHDEMASYGLSATVGGWL